MRIWFTEVEAGDEGQALERNEVRCCRYVEARGSLSGSRIGCFIESAEQNLYTTKAIKQKAWAVSTVIISAIST